MSSSRRSFLGAGLALPVIGSAALTPQSTPAAKTKPELKPETKFRVLGKTGLKVTRVSFGCMVTSDPSVITRAADEGIPHFDTARVYSGGNNERMVAAALKGKRQNVILSTKSVRPTKDGVLDDLNTSLRELQTDYVDIWYLHSKSRPEDVKDELLEAQRIAKQQGKIRFAGISFHGGHEKMFPLVLSRKDHFDVVLFSYNFAMGAGTDALIEQAHKAGLGTVAMKVMAGGLRRTGFYPISDETHAKLQKEGAMVSALKWVLKNPNVDTTIPSMVDMDQLEENMRAMAAPFGPADATILAKHLDYMRPLYCRYCGSCEGSCEKGLPVADMLRFLMYAEGYGQFSMGRENFRQLPEEMAAVRCGDCTACSVKCPNGVAVAQRLARAQEIFG